MKTLCRIRDIYRSIVELEGALQRRYGLGLNEGMLLCSLSRLGSCTSGEVAALLGLSCSNTSKVIASAEKKGLIQRALGDHDRRQMYFVLTEKGQAQLSLVREHDLELPELLKTILSAIND
ncbi:MAG: MarR family transcriptional regulator [Prevotellaceae bacterium]|jgi:DNA-binding MarR family transcriptional regulator|nr:MarR family transcriptional regulator [Prevotellaceae bacterium]